MVGVPTAAMAIGLYACGGNGDGSSSQSHPDRAVTATLIKHVVVIYNENVSFDHYFATYPNAANPAGEPAFTPAAGTPAVMANTSLAEVSAKLQRAPYQNDFTKLFGPHVFESTELTTSEAMFAIARYQIEEQSFHPYTSKYDYWLEGKARFFVPGRTARLTPFQRSRQSQLRRLSPVEGKFRRRAADVHRLPVRSARRAA
jgi:phospholipase C